MMKQSNKFLLLTDYGNFSKIIDDVELLTFKERHFVKLDSVERKSGQEAIHTALSKDAFNKLFQKDDHQGVVLQLAAGMPCRVELLTAKKVLSQKKPLWFYWHNEKAIEHIDGEKLASYWRHWLFIKSLVLRQRVAFSVSCFFSNIKSNYHKIKTRIDTELEAALRVSRHKIIKNFKDDSLFLKVLRKIKYLFSRKSRMMNSIITQYNVATNTAFLQPYSDRLQNFLTLPKMDSTSFEVITTPGGELSVRGVGWYFRLDFWADIKAGGSYGHTCYVAQQLKNKSEGLTAFMPNYYSLLEELNVRQILLDKVGEGHEKNVVLATDYYYDRLKTAVQITPPQFIYERICLGNYTGARLAQEFSIPYIVEYNGSEIAMMKSFGNGQYQFADYHLGAESAAFNQATVISVVSQVIANDLIAQGIPENKILVNPNGVDPNQYAPVSAEEKLSLKASYGWDDSHVVIGFVGTFGGWHGIDVLAKSLHAICELVPHARFLLIGDGNYRHYIDEAIETNHLSDKVILTGMVPQQNAVKLLQTCDIYVSPHSTHMKDSQFFGSPTKIFEYMALQGGIVASDLMQIGEVLRPALFANALNNQIKLSNERAILCTPGDLQEFINAVVFLAKNPSMSQRLGANARKAVIAHFTWEQHVARLWRFINKEGQDYSWVVPQHPENEEKKSEFPAEYLASDDFYKLQAQAQWNNDPCGSHYVKNSQPHTLDWFLEAERYRYEEYAPWMFEAMGFNRFREQQILEVGAGMGTDLAQFAKHGAIVSDLDLSVGHLNLAKENFALRDLKGQFYHGDAENMPFTDESFDMVYSNGVIHHSPNTHQIVKEMWRVLKPGGEIKIMVYAENSLHYWRNLVTNEWWQRIGLKESSDKQVSIGEIMSQTVELSDFGAKPLVKVYTKTRLRALFAGFTDIQIVQRQMLQTEIPASLRWIPASFLGKLLGWNLILTAKKPNFYTASIPAASSKPREYSE